MKDDTVLSFEQLNTYINTHVKDDNLIDDWVYGWFVPTMKDIMLTTFKAVKHKLAHKVRALETAPRDFRDFLSRKFLSVLGFGGNHVYLCILTRSGIINVGFAGRWGSHNRGSKDRGNYWHVSEIFGT